MNTLFDVHCHLQDEKIRPQMARVMERAQQAGVTRLVCCGTTEKDWPEVLRLAGAYPARIIPALGLHPWHIAHRPADWLLRLAEGLRGQPCAVGEIGLDHAIEDRDDHDQEMVFMEQMTLARQLKRPACLHVRRAWGRLVDLLKKPGLCPSGFLIHSFSGSADLIEPLAQAGAYFSFSGSITHPGNKRGIDAVRKTPLDRLLIETDAPDLPPQTPEGPAAVNEPALLPFVARKVAEIKGLSEEEVAIATWNNACRLFQDILS